MDRTAPTFSYIASDDAHTNPLPSWSSSPAAFSSIITLTLYGSLSSLTSMAFAVTSISVPGGSLSCICMLYDLGITSGGAGSTARSISAIAACQLPWQISRVHHARGHDAAAQLLVRVGHGDDAAKGARGGVGPPRVALLDPEGLETEAGLVRVAADEALRVLVVRSLDGERARAVHQRMPASAAGCFGELQGLTSWPSCTKRAHSRRAERAGRCAESSPETRRRRRERREHGARGISREVELDLRSHAAPAGDAQPQTHRKRVSVDAAARAASISRAATASDRAKASRAARLATALPHDALPLSKSAKGDVLSRVVPGPDVSSRAFTNARSGLGERAVVVHRARCVSDGPREGFRGRPSCAAQWPAGNDRGRYFVLARFFAIKPQASMHRSFRTCLRHSAMPAPPFLVGVGVGFGRGARQSRGRVRARCQGRQKGEGIEGRRRDAGRTRRRQGAASW